MKIYMGTYDLDSNKWVAKKGDINITEDECAKKGLLYKFGTCFDIEKNGINFVVGEGHRDPQGKVLLVFYAIMSDQI